MHKSVFTIGEFKYVYIGYTGGRRWNGWATPYFEKDEALAVMHDYNECAENPMEYDEVYDQFYILDKETAELETWKGEKLNTDEGIKHLYGIGAYCWMWEEITDYDINSIARGIEDFLWEYDTYNHKDVYGGREELTEEIITQLKELNTLKRVIQIFYSQTLTEELKFEKLGKELKL